MRSGEMNAHGEGAPDPMASNEQEAFREAVRDLHSELLDRCNDDTVTAAYACWVRMQDGEDRTLCLEVIETLQAAMSPAERRVASNARRITETDVAAVAARHARHAMSVTQTLDIAA